MNKIVSCLFFLCLLSVMVSAVPTNGLVAYYQFAGNANDSGQYGYDGTVQGASLTTDRFGHANSAYYFDGNDKISASGAQFDTTQYTLSAWFKADSTSATQFIVSHGESYDTDKIQYGLYVENSIVKSWYETSSDADYVLSDSSTVSANQWYFATVSLDSAGTYNLYINGVLKTTQTSMPSPASINHFLSIGYRTNSGNVQQNYFTGAIDEVTVYNRALSNSEIVDLYNSNVPEPCTLSMIAIALLGFYYRKILSTKK